MASPLTQARAQALPHAFSDLTSSTHITGLGLCLTTCVSLPCAHLLGGRLCLLCLRASSHWWSFIVPLPALCFTTDPVPSNIPCIWLWQPGYKAVGPGLNPTFVKDSPFHLAVASGYGPITDLLSPGRIFEGAAYTPSFYFLCQFFLIPGHVTSDPSTH